MEFASSLQGLQTALDSAESARDQAIQNHFSTTEGVRRLRAQSQQLLAYRLEYQQRWTTQFKQLAAIEVVTSYQRFVARLDQAIDQLHQQTLHAEQEEVQARELLISHETRVASVRKLIDRRRQAQVHKLGRQDQRQTDDTAAVMAQRAPRVWMNNS